VLRTGLGEHIDEEELPPALRELLQLRLQARRKKDWCSVDTLRAAVLEEGYNILDFKAAQIVTRVQKRDRFGRVVNAVIDAPSCAPNRHCFTAVIGAYRKRLRAKSGVHDSADGEREAEHSEYALDEHERQECAEKILGLFGAAVSRGVSFDQIGYVCALAALPHASSTPSASSESGTALHDFALALERRLGDVAAERATTREMRDREMKAAGAKAWKRREVEREKERNSDAIELEAFGSGLVQMENLVEEETGRVHAQSVRWRCVELLLQLAAVQQVAMYFGAYTAALEIATYYDDEFEDQGDAMVVQLFTEMQRNGLTPTPAMYHTAVLATGKTGNWRQAIEIFDQMLGYYPEMSSERNETYNAVVAVVANNGGEEAMIYNSGNWYRSHQHSDGFGDFGTE
jgi:hypothetical protein